MARGGPGSADDQAGWNKGHRATLDTASRSGNHGRGYPGALEDEPPRERRDKPSRAPMAAHRRPGLPKPSEYRLISIGFRNRPRLEACRVLELRVISSEA